MHSGSAAAAPGASPASHPGAPVTGVISLLLNNKSPWELKYSFAPFRPTRVCSYTNEFYIWQDKFCIELKEISCRGSLAPLISVTGV